MLKYEYDRSLDEAYQRSLIKSFKKTIDDGLFNFIIVDMVNEKMGPVNEMSAYGKAKGFFTFIIELDKQASLCCFNKNIHNRSLEEIYMVKFFFDILCVF